MLFAYNTVRFCFVDVRTDKVNRLAESQNRKDALTDWETNETQKELYLTVSKKDQFVAGDGIVEAIFVATCFFDFQKPLIFKCENDFYSELAIGLVIGFKRGIINEMPFGWENQ